MIRRLRSGLVLLPTAGFVLLAACGDSGTNTPAVDRVRVTPEETALGTLGESVQFQAQALDAAGAPLGGLEYSWVSSDETVATVGDNGRATATGVGETFIRATTAGVTGEARLAVRECGAPVSLAPGQWVTVDLPGENACGFILPAGSGGDRYRIALVRTGSSPDEFDVPTVSLEMRTLGAQDGPEAAPAAPRPAAAGPGLVAHPRGLELARSTERFHLALRAQEARMIEALGGEALLESRTASARRVAAVDAPARIMIDPTTPALCTPAGTPTPAFKVAENDFLAIYQDSAQAQLANRQITASQAQRMLDYYAAYGKPVIDDYFGGVSDIDGNGKVLVVAHPVVDGNTAAFVWSGDFFPKVRNGEPFCPASNEAEMIYFNYSLIQALDDDVHQALETLVHEVKHVSSLHKSIARGNRLGQSSYHPGWIEEGSAEIAGNMSSRRGWAAVGGPAPNTRVTEQTIRDSALLPGNGGLHPEFYGVFLRLFRTQGYLSSQPNGVVVDPQGADSDHSIYGSGWTFLRWLGDAYGAAATAAYADAPFFLQQNDSLAPPGVEGLESLTGRSFPQLMVEYAVAVMLNGTSAPAPPRAITSYDFVSAIEVWCFAADNPPCDGSTAGPVGTFPWPVTTAANGVMSRPFADAIFSGRIGAAGLRIHDFHASGSASAEVLVSAPSGTRVVVLRLQ
jgi:hypothetical protein